jgi:hypothetical protein
VVACGNAEAPRCRHDVSYFIPWRRCLAEKNGRSAIIRSVRVSVPSKTASGYPALAAARTAWRSFGARTADSPTVWVTYRHAVAVPAPEPGRQLRERLALQVSQYQQSLLAGVQLPPPLPGRGPVPADQPGREGEGRRCSMQLRAMPARTGTNPGPVAVETVAQVLVS